MQMNNSIRKKTSGAKMWFLVWALGLAGQLSWSTSSQWLNIFVYAKIAKNPTIITSILICSALACTFSTFFFGTWADRTGKRRICISAGYIMWGIFTIIFGLTQFIPTEMYVLAGIVVVATNTVMSFFGSMGTDAGYNTWTNDIMTEKNSGQIGAAIATQPVLGMIIGSVVGGLIVGENENFMALFLAMGIFIIVFGIISMFSLSKSDDVEPSVRGSFGKQFFSVFNFRNIAEHKELMWVNILVSVFFIGFNIYFPYLGNYLVYYLGYPAHMMGIIEAIPLVIAILVSVPVSGLLNKNKHVFVSVLAIVLNIIGAFIMFPIKAESIDTSKIFDLRVFIGIFLLGVGYITVLQTAKVWCKQLYPKDSKGQFEGLWLICYSLIPAVGGSLIGQAVIKTSGKTFLDTVSGQMNYIPNGNIFIFGSILITLSLVPVLLAAKHHKKRTKN